MYAGVAVAVVAVGKAPGVENRRDGGVSAGAGTQKLPEFEKDAGLEKTGSHGPTPTAMLSKPANGAVTTGSGSPRRRLISSRIWSSSRCCEATIPRSCRTEAMIRRTASTVWMTASCVDVLLLESALCGCEEGGGRGVP